MSFNLCCFASALIVQTRFSSICIFLTLQVKDTESDEVGSIDLSRWKEPVQEILQTLSEGNFCHCFTWKVSEHGFTFYAN